MTISVRVTTILATSSRIALVLMLLEAVRITLKALLTV
jgi:hypothetical protein